MKRTFRAIFHEDFSKDIDGLDGSLKKKAKKKVDEIIGNQFGYLGHSLSSQLLGFRSASFESTTYKVIFSYCEECLRVGRNRKFMSGCSDCPQISDKDLIIFWRIIRHKEADRDGYKLVSKELTKMFPPNKI